MLEQQPEVHHVRVNSLVMRWLEQTRWFPLNLSYSRCRCISHRLMTYVVFSVPLLIEIVFCCRIEN